MTDGFFFLFSSGGASSNALNLKRLHDRLVAYDYDDSDFNHIKSPYELNQSGGGVCWDFVVAEASDLQRQWLEYHCKSLDCTEMDA